MRSRTDITSRTSLRSLMNHEVCLIARASDLGFASILADFYISGLAQHREAHLHTGGGGMWGRNHISFRPFGNSVSVSVCTPLRNTRLSPGYFCGQNAINGHQSIPILLRKVCQVYDALGGVGNCRLNSCSSSHLAQPRAGYKNVFFAIKTSLPVRHEPAYLTFSTGI